MKSPQTSLEEKHLPVMINEVLKICNPKMVGTLWIALLVPEAVIQKNY